MPDDKARAATSTDAESLIDFPAELAVKAMGLDEDDFASCVEAIVTNHLADADYRVSRQGSSGGKYVSVRVHFVAENLDQLKSIYADLRAESRVLFLL